jgi:hypothetical protein
MSVNIDHIHEGYMPNIAESVFEDACDNFTNRDMIVSRLSYRVMKLYVCGAKEGA